MYVLFAADGVRGRYAQWPDDVDVQIQRRQAEARRAAAVLGVAEVTFLPYVDQYVTASPPVIRSIEAVVAEVQPRVIYTHRRVDENCDHQETAEATLIAARFWAGRTPASVEEVRGFPVPPVAATDGLRLVVKLLPAELDRKLDAFCCYESELLRLSTSHPWRPHMLRAQAEVWGSWIGAPYAEAFELLWRRDA